MKIRTSAFWALGLACLALGVLPCPAFAWGPGVHMITGNWVLQNLGMLAPAVALPLMRYPGQYLHGILSADIFIGKGSKAKAGHSHNWSSGLALLAKTDTPSKKAYAYGYLSHLAADVVAHNVFVPGLAHTVPASGKTAHIYLEAQADRLLDWDYADALSVFKETESPAACLMLRDAMRQKGLPFRLKRGLFQSSIAIGGSRWWRGSMRFVDCLLPGRERKDLLFSMMQLSTRAIFDVLRSGTASPLLRLDPIGADALCRCAAPARPHLSAAPPALPRSAIAQAAPPVPRIAIPDTLRNLPPVCRAGEPREQAPS